MGSTKNVRIDCYIIEGCGSEASLKEVLEQVRQQAPFPVEIRFHKLTATKAQELGIAGSPTVLVNGKDIAPEEHVSAGT